MKKRLLKLSLLLGTTLGVIGFGAISSNAISANAVTDINVASNWVLEKGADTIKATDITGGVRVGMITGNYARMYLNKKVPLDGLSFSFNNVVGANCTADGFYLSKDINTGDSGFFPTSTYTLWHAPYGGTQARLSVCVDHDYNGTATCYTSSTFETAGFSVASSMVMNNHVSTNDGVKVKFEKYNDTAWKVTFTELYASTIWRNNANYDSATKSCHVFLKNSDVANYIDADGQVYLHVFTVGNYTDNYIEVTNLSYLEKYTKTELEAKVAAITDTMIDSFINKPAIIANLTTLKAAAIEHLKTAPASGAKADYIPVFNFLDAWDGRYSAYGYVDGAATIETGLPFTNFAGANAAKFSAQNDYQLSIGQAWGSRLYYNNEINLTNFVVAFNMGLLDVSSVFAFVANPSDQPGGYINESYKYFHIEIYKYGAEDYLIVFSNTTSHNVSMSSFATDTQGSYTGKKIKSSSGDFSFAFTTDLTTNKTMLNINKGAIEFEVSDNKDIYKNVNPRDPIMGKVAFASFSSTTDNRAMVTEIRTTVTDSPDKYYTKGEEKEVKLLFDNISVGEILSFTIDGNEFPVSSYEKTTRAILLKPFFMDCLQPTNFTILLTGENGTATWTLHVTEGKKAAPFIAKSSVYLKSDNIYDVNFNMVSFGTDVSKYVFKVDGNDMAAESYAISNYNTTLTLNTSFLSSLAVGKHVVTISVSGVAKVCKLFINIA